MDVDEARAVLLRAFAATGELPAEMLALLEVLLTGQPVQSDPGRP